MSTVSTTVNEVVVTGRKKRRLIDKAAKLWLRISEWTKACDVEFNDGRTAQEKVGAINGITSNFGLGEPDIAASSFLTKKIKDDLNEGIINDRIQLVIDNDGNLGWKKDGADTVTPFSRMPDTLTFTVIPGERGDTGLHFTTNIPPEIYPYVTITPYHGWGGGGINVSKHPAGKYRNPGDLSIGFSHNALREVNGIITYSKK